MGIGDRIKGLMGFFRRTERHVQQHTRDRVDHVILLDGTMSTLDEGDETNVGLIYKLLAEASTSQNIGILYEAGTQWSDWSKTLDIIEGRGINRQIQRTYGWLASRYRPGDRIFLIGYSRGAYAVRSLAGVIDRVGLVKSDFATERMVREAYRHYRFETDPATAAKFAASYCHPNVPIEMIGVFDTVKSLGFRAPFVWKWEEVKHAFHNHEIGPSVRHAFHENREAFTPVFWDCPPDHPGSMEQVWFRGSHGDVGGQLSGYNVARPLSNIPLVWMLDRMERCDLRLPSGWRQRFPTDPDAKSVGTTRGWGKYFLARRRRVMGRDPSESLHPTASGRSPRAREFEKQAVNSPA